MTYAETLDDRTRRRARINAYASTWFGCVSEIMLDTSAIIILFMTAMQGSDVLAMLTTTVTGISSIFLQVPAAALIPRLGLKRSVNIACVIGLAGFLLISISPLFGSFAKYMILLGCTIYAIERPLYSSAWYPLLDNFLRPEDRGSFFGTMRFSYNLMIGGLFFAVGLLMGNNPPVWLLQAVTAFAGLCLIGRSYYISKFPVDPNIKQELPDIRKALKISLTNGPLVGYSVYACMYALSTTVLFPLTLIYLKSYVKIPAGHVQIISTVGIAGGVVGYFCYGKLLKVTSLRFIEIMVHAGITLIAFTLFFYRPELPGFLIMVAFLIFLLSFFGSSYACCNSAEMMALARPGNKVMATAFCSMYNYIGVAGGRLISALLMGTAFLAPVWQTESGVTYSSYQTIFLGCGVMMIIMIVLFPLLPSIIPKHDDYYEPAK